MANITRVDPFTELARFDPFGDDFFKGFSLQPVFQRMEIDPQMRLDVSEDDKVYTVKAEIPGVTKEDIKVSIDGNRVSISAEVKKEREEKDGEEKDGEGKEGSKVIRRERYFGSVSRSFTLAQDVDEGSAQARYDSGVLVLTLPK